MADTTPVSPNNNCRKSVIEEIFSDTVSIPLYSNKILRIVVLGVYVKKQVIVHIPLLIKFDLIIKASSSPEIFLAL